MGFQKYIGGKWVKGRDGKTFDTISPTDEKFHERDWLPTNTEEQGKKAPCSLYLHGK